MGGLGVKLYTGGVSVGGVTLGLKWGGNWGVILMVSLLPWESPCSRLALLRLLVQVRSMQEPGGTAGGRGVRRGVGTSMCGR